MEDAIYVARQKTIKAYDWANVPYTQEAIEAEILFHWLYQNGEITSQDVTGTFTVKQDSISPHKGQTFECYKVYRNREGRIVFYNGRRIEPTWICDDLQINLTSDHIQSANLYCNR